MNESKTNINWYPGHMAKARREITDAMSKVDIVLELVDARCPEASRNPILNEIIGKKPRIIVLNKADLSDDKVNKEWVSSYKKENQVKLVKNLQESNKEKNKEFILKNKQLHLELMKKKALKMDEIKFN